MTQQFYQLTLSEAIALHKCGLIQAPALLYFFLRTRLAPGWKMTLHQQEISQHLGISRTAFYKAIQKLKDKGLIDWEVPNGLVVTVAESATQSQKVQPSSRKCDSVAESATSVAESATQSQKVQPSSRKCDSVAESATSVAESATSVAESATSVAESATATPAKPAPVKASSDSPDSYQIFIKSLSNSTREKFFNFVREKIKDFSKPINDVSAWLASFNQAGQERFRVYYSMFQSEIGEAFAPSQDWANHPQYQEWLEALRRYPKGFPYMKEWAGSLEEKKAFADWAFGNNLVWESKT